ncbi:SelB C-terminal domain-containing protein [Ornithinimicrobium sp. Y1847]|uniref:SelB domain-containing protein n=1 Tax=unclassified Ornithinimicrobium TaxID=2615080 RepID=UPI003B66DF66
MHVVATAGHVDHGKSTLVRALTGMEPDRWAEERRRGLTIDLGYAWTALEGAGGDGGAEDVAFVDVPGHRRFIGNMLAGLGPSPAVLLVVAADEGWREQTEEHLRAVEALGLRHALLVVTRADLADPGPALAQAQERLAQSPLGGGRARPSREASGVAAVDLLDGAGVPAVDRLDDAGVPAVDLLDGAGVPAVAVSAVTGQGLPELRRELAALCSRLPRPPAQARVRLWVDRAFTIRGSGTVVTGTLEAGTLRSGDQLVLAHRAADGSGTTQRPVTVRALQSLGAAVDEVPAPARVAVNLRGLPHELVRRGDALLTPDSWPFAREIDVLLDQDPEVAELPATLTLHVGSLHLPARLRPLHGAAARVLLDRPLPLQAGDRAILREPGAEGSIVGLGVLDVAPPRLTRRGSARARGEQLLAEQAQAEALAGHPQVDQPGAEQPSADQPSTQQASADQPSTQRASAEQAGAQQPDPEGTADDRRPGAGALISQPARRLEAEVSRRGHLTVADARLLDLDPDLAPTGRALVTGPTARPDHSPAPCPTWRLPLTDPDLGVVRLGDHLVSRQVLVRWEQALLDAVDRRAREQPLDPLTPLAAARDLAHLPDTAVVEEVARFAGLEVAAGRVARPGTRPDLGPAQAGLDTVLARLAEQPFVAPEADDLSALGLGRREIAAAEARGDLLRLADGVVLLPRSPALAMAELARLPQPFTTSQARQALGTSRRVAIPLLEHLDARGWTRRVDQTHRVVVR